MEISIIIQIATLLVSTSVLAINLIFSRIENSKKHLLENITKQRKDDMLELKKISSTICMLTDNAIINQKIKDATYLEILIFESKKMDFILRRDIEEEFMLISVKDTLIDYVIQYSNKKKNIMQIKKYNKLFYRISGLFICTVWQHIKEQAKNHKNIPKDRFCKLYEENKKKFLALEDEDCIKKLYTF